MQIKTDAERHAALTPLDSPPARPVPVPVLRCLACGRNLAIALHAPGCTAPGVWEAAA